MTLTRDGVHHFMKKYRSQLTNTDNFRGLSGDPMAGKVTKDALAHLERLFATSATALGSTMAGRAESGVGAPEVVSAQVAALAADLLSALELR